jgi:hypothetical protein
MSGTRGIGTTATASRTPSFTTLGRRAGLRLVHEGPASGTTDQASARLTGSAQLGRSAVRPLGSMP